MNDTVRKGGKPKGSPKSGGGSRKGIPNKTSASLKEMILGALDESGGVSYLVERAKDPRTASAFLSLVGKVLPMQVTGANGEALAVTLNVKFD